MKRTQLWSVAESEGGELRAVSLKELENTETEARLEELLVASPELLLDNLKLIGRQLPTEGSALDLLGVDQDGQLVLLELKRSTLTRDAVAQILDYVSDLSGKDPEQLALLIQERSGQDSVEEIEDFANWHAREYPQAPSLLEEPPRMLLVGLGVDDRAKRIVNFLADSGIDIELQTFHAFDSAGTLFLAKQVETLPPSPPKPRSRGLTKEERRQILLELAAQQGARDLLLTVADFIHDRMQQRCYRWPGKTAYSFSLEERTAEGRATLRSYVTLYVHRQKRETLLLAFAPRAVAAAPAAVANFADTVPSAHKLTSSWAPLQVEIDSSTWPLVADHLAPLLEALLAARKRSASQEEADESPSTADDRAIVAAS